MIKIKKKKRRRKNEDTLLKLSANKMFLFLFTALLVAGLVTNGVNSINFPCI